MFLDYKSGCGGIQGRVYDKETKEPVKNASIILIGTGFKIETNDKGYYHIKDISVQLYDIKVEHRDYELELHEGVPVAEDMTTTEIFNLKRK